MNIATIRNISRLGWAILVSAAAVFAVLLLQSTPSWAQTSGGSGDSGSTGAAIASGGATSTASSGAGSGSTSGSGSCF